MVLPQKDERVILAMEKYGGDFVKSLAVCFRRADYINYQKLEKTFANYINEYRLIANQE